jgi:hypothetical protein
VAATVESRSESRESSLEDIALLSVDKTVLQNGAVAIDQDCKLQYIAQPPAKL